MLTIESSVNVVSPAADFKAQPAAASLQQSPLFKAMKAQYQADQQVKYLRLEAETESLLQQLQALKRQREQLAGVALSQPPAP